MTQSAQLLNHLFAPFGGLYVELTFIDLKGHYELDPHIYTESYQIGRDRIDWSQVAAANARGYSVYYAVTPKKKPTPRYNRSRELDAAFCQALWVDIDLHDHPDMTLDQAFAALHRFEPMPSVIIETGGGLHGIWRIEPIPVSPKTLRIIKSHLRGLALYLNADTSVAELARVLRLPGTINTKPERGGALCRFADDAAPRDVTYRLEQFPHVQAPPAIDRPMRDTPPDAMPGYVRWYLTTPHAEGNRNNALNWTAWQMYHDGFTLADAESLLTARAIASGLDERSVLATIRSTFKARA